MYISPLSFSSSYGVPSWVLYKILSRLQLQILLNIRHNVWIRALVVVEYYVKDTLSLLMLGQDSAVAVTVCCTFYTSFMKKKWNKIK